MVLYNRFEQLNVLNRKQRATHQHVNYSNILHPLHSSHNSYVISFCPMAKVRMHLVPIKVGAYHMGRHMGHPMTWHILLLIAECKLPLRFFMVDMLSASGVEILIFIPEVHNFQTGNSFVQYQISRTTSLFT